MDDLTNRIALVTGASQGIGRAIALRLAEAGADVAIGYNNGRDGAEQVVQVITQMGRRALAVQGDVSTSVGIASLIENVEADLGLIDILISNAGNEPHGTLESITEEAWDNVMNTHLRAAFFLSKELVPGMRERGYGRLLFISSVAAFTGGIIGPHYAAAKAGLIGLMHSLATSLALHNITVNALAPSLIEDAGTWNEGNAWQSLLERVPAGHFGRSEDVADFALAIVTNPYLTAQTLLLDGGLYPR
jgi:3-oxoacyl-[acyl-carrier protein] reductase